jgi:hypothetical protein
LFSAVAQPVFLTIAESADDIRIALSSFGLTTHSTPANRFLHTPPFPLFNPAAALEARDIAIMQALPSSPQEEKRDSPLVVK